NQLNGLNNKLVSQITCEQKSHANYNAKQLKEIESLKSTVKSLESIISSIQKASSLKDSDIISLENSDDNQLHNNSFLEIKVKELENEKEQVTQNSSFKDGLIFCLRSRVRDLEDELDQIVLQPHQLINDLKIGSAEADPVSSSNDYALAPLAKRGKTVEEVSYFLHTAQSLNLMKAK
ncbi:12773_t:CDS:2, partial [Funneliformis geosporum]